MPSKKRRLFSEISPTTYAISVKKGIIKRRIQDLFSNDKLASTFSKEPLPVLLDEHCSNQIKKGKGIDPQLQYNKLTNITLASKKINGLIIHPGEMFSFWRLVGRPTPAKGYKDGRVIIAGRLIPGTGGGLCNLANAIHVMVLHSPLTVTEVHFHSDALAPDHGPHVPMSSGTSISYNYIDLRFVNTTDQDLQILAWCEDGYLHAQLRCQKEIPWRYEITEDDHHFEKEEDTYYRVSKIYRETYEKESGKLLDRKLIRDNHSEVMFDVSQIPPELIRS